MTILKDKILTLRNEGKTYTRIAEELNCSKSTICYYIGEGQKEKNSLRRTKYRSTLNAKLWKKIKEFRRVTSSNVSIARRDRSLSGKSFTPTELLEKTGSICYLTGRGIDLNNTSSYNLDHIVPRTSEGTNELYNCGLACKEANQAKFNLSLEEFFQLCIDVVKHNKLSVD